ncbi:Crp/Fnr family transcriptional regulator [Consotaella aegiceratis]|uniref:Crp/Fnr family transcriptional regulator n=1 Tax=Consotaella aegiceratis TaxID=3097961 RepID=UPI002F3E5146
MKPGKLDRSLVKDLAVFHSLPDENLDAILALASVRRLPSGTTVFNQGDRAAEFFALLNGHLKVVQTTPDGQQVVVRHVNPGEIYGIARAIGQTEYPGTATAVAESLTLAWPMNQWDFLVARCPALAVNTLATVGQRLQDAHARIRELSTEEVERRVAHALLRLVKQAGKPTDDGVLIDFPITRQDVAEMTGTTLHTVSRILTAWEARGLVSSGRKKIVVCDPNGLVALADAAE